MKKMITAISLLATYSAYADVVTGVGMQGYFVYQDSNGNKYVKHPTVPGVAYDLSGKKLDTIPNGMKYATIQQDGTIVPIGEHSNGIFTTFSWLVALALVGSVVWVALKNKKKIMLARQEVEALGRIKENITNEAGNIFVKFHKNYRPSQIDYFEQNTSGALLVSIRDSILKESDFKDVSIISLKSEVQNVYREQEKPAASVRFTCVRTESADGKNKQVQSNEIWTLHLIENKWVISEIKEMAPPVINENQEVVEDFKLAEKEMGASQDKLGL